MKKKKLAKKVKSSIPYDVLNIVTPYLESTSMVNTHAAFYFQPDNLPKQIKYTCIKYRKRLAKPGNDYKRFWPLSDKLINKYCYMFMYLRGCLENKMIEYAHKYYLCGREEIPRELCEIVQYYNTITEAILRFLWLRCHFSDNHEKLQGYTYAQKILFKDKSMLHGEKSRLSSRYLSCMAANVYEQFVETIIKYADYISLSDMYYDLNFPTEIHLTNLYYPNKLANNFSLKRYTLVRDRRKTPYFDWRVSNDIFLELTVDNPIYSESYHAIQGVLEENKFERCAEVFGCSKSDLNGAFYDNIGFYNTGTCAGTLVSFGFIAQMIHEVEELEKSADNNFMEFSQNYFRRLKEAQPNAMPTKSMSWK